MKITFVHCVDPYYSQTQMFGVYFMPVWAYTLASHLEQIADVPLEMDLFDNRLKDEREIGPADFFLFTGINQDYKKIKEVHGNLKKRFPSSLFCIGGPISWSFKQAGKLDELRMFDHIFIGDGEEAITDFFRQIHRGLSPPPILETKERFGLGQALPMSRRLMDPSVLRYYGGVIEVSRGCPFLCEFCDIRVLPDNNRAHNKKASRIVEELDYFFRKGVHNILFACDNFIGSPTWAEEVCDEIIRWKKETGAQVSIYTWLTINLSAHPRLLKKLRLSGFDMFFIGVESFNKNSLLETAKLQNSSISMEDALTEIQSYGFIVVAGLIFGFDTDPDNIVDITLEGIAQSGLISGDPSLLTALPGTPLYKRMKFSGRLREGKVGLGGHKYQTNILYLRPEENIRQDFRRFVREFNRGKYQLRRLRQFYACLNLGNFFQTKQETYIDARKVLKMTLGNLQNAGALLRRLYGLLCSPERFFYLMLAILLTFRHSSKDKSLWPYFKFWVFNWTNTIFKYSHVKDSEFDIGSVDPSFSRDRLVPPEYREPDDAPIPEAKIRAQRKATIKMLESLAPKGVDA